MIKVLILVALGTHIMIGFAAIPAREAHSGSDCISFRTVLQQSLVKSAASYFSENPISGRPSFSPSTVQPLNALNLYRSYYGEDASPEKFTRSVLDILYADPASIQPSRPFDKINLRRRIYLQGIQQKFKYARTLFGRLLYNDISEFGEDDWKVFRCIQQRNEKMAEEIILMETSRLRKEIGEENFKNFLSLDAGTNLAFVIDDTGSMAAEIEAIGRRTKLLINEREGSLDQPTNFVLVPFNDPRVGPVTATNDPDIIQAAMDRMFAHGGGDLPELSMRGLSLALEKSPPGTTIYVITDAEAKDAELQDEVLAIAKKKRIRLTFLLTERMTSWLCAGIASTRRLAACRDPSLKLGFELYEHLANSTGGDALVVSRNDIFEATELVDISLKHGLVDLEKRTVKDGNGNIAILVDSSVKQLYVFASGSCNSIQLRSGGSSVPFESTLKVGHLFVGGVNVTQHGRYNLAVNTDGECRVTVSAKSSKGFISTLARAVGDEADPTHLEILESDPTSSENIFSLIDLYGFEETDEVQTISFVDDETGKVLHSASPDDGSKRHFRVDLRNLSGKIVSVYIGGMDGSQFQRLAQQSIRFVNVEIDCSAIDDAVVRAGTPTQVAVSIRNLGAENGYFSLGASDDEKFITSISQSRIFLQQNREQRFFIRLRAPADTAVGTTSVITITLKDRNGTVVYKECSLTISPKSTPDIEYFRVTSNIHIRFAETIIESKFVNDDWSSKEAVFFVSLPNDAFITEFTMAVGGETFTGEIMEIDEAKKFYEIGKRHGITIGRVSQNGQETIFQTSLNLEGDEDAVFKLTYQQQLSRILGRYRHSIHINPGQAVDSLRVEVNIQESLPIVNLRVLNFETEQTSLPGGIAMNNVIETNSGNSGQVVYFPTKDQRTDLSPLGLNGKFSVEYDLLRPSDTISDLVGFGNNFLHFVVPEYDLMGKRVAFLLDNSGSMSVHNLEELKKSMNLILDDLRVEDSFCIIFFNSKLQMWDPHSGDDTRSIMVPATTANIAAAKEFLSSITAQGGSDILKGLETALNVIGGYTEDEDITPHFSTDFVLLLTDDRSSNVIASSVTNLNKLKFGIHTVALGPAADVKTLSAIASQNNGKFAHLHSSLEQAEEIKHFFDEFSSPMLRDIEMRYPSGLLIPATKTSIDHYQQGTEMIIAGRFADGRKCSSVSAEGRRNGDPDFVLTAKADGENVITEENLLPACDEIRPEMDALVDRQEKFLEIADALNELEEVDDENVKLADELREKIQNLSRENNFVVPDHTALVVSKPGDIKEVDDTIAAELEDEARRLLESSTTTSPTPPTTAASTIPSGAVMTPAFGGIPSTTLVPFTASRPRLEFFGDPHFVIDIEQQITLCFNWDGKEGQTINLLHDPESGITVNGRIVTSNVQTSNSKNIRTYVDKLGVLIPDQNISMIVNSKEVVLHTGKKGRIYLLFGKYGTRKRKNVVLKMRPVTKYKSTLFIHIDKKIVFRVISRINSKSDFVKDHLDFAVIRGDGLADSAVGVLGQFSRFRASEKVPASIEFRAGGKTALLWYRHNPIEVSYHTLKDYNADREIECWYMADKKQLWENEEEMFVVKNILDTPKGEKRVHRR